MSDELAGSITHGPAHHAGRPWSHPDFNVQPGLLRRALLEAGWLQLPVQAQHVLAVADLPHLHHDPFDRLLLAQANAESLLLSTADQQLAQYPGQIRRMASRPACP